MTGVYRAMLSFAFLFITFAASAQKTATVPEAAPPSIWSNPMAITMLAIIFVLLLVIALMANVVLGTASWHSSKMKSGIVKTIAGLIVFLSPAVGFAQDAATTAPAAPASIAGLTPLTFYLLAFVIAIELIVIIVMGLFVRNFLVKEKAVAAVAANDTTVSKPAGSFSTWWDKINSFRPADQESKIDMGHDYDGIRELDNKLPGWWLYGFYLTIIIGVIYLYRYHIAETAPLSKQEFDIAWQRGEEQKAVFLAKSANNVDENSVALITEPAVLASAKEIFQKRCFTCHGMEGQGNTIGPNLTDDYWIHSGGIKDIFKSIKYGWPEKGMQSWKDEYSPIQIAQLTSYVKSLHGTNPPAPKEKQGELYQENAAAPPTDSAAVKEVKTDPIK